MKVLLVATLAFFSYTSNAQVYKFKAFETFFDSEDTSSKIFADKNWDTVDFLVYVNIDRHKIETFGKKELHLQISETLEEETNADRDEILKYYAFDNNGFGDKVGVTLVLFKNREHRQIATLILKYPSGTFHFRLRQND